MSIVMDYTHYLMLNICVLSHKILLHVVVKMYNCYIFLVLFFVRKCNLIFLFILELNYKEEC